MSAHPLYETWRNMVRRCHAPGFPDFKHYGARGIQVWPAWRDDFQSFADWIESNLGSRPEGMTLDRIDNDRGYDPENLKWATWSEQNRNRRGTASAETAAKIREAYEAGEGSPRVLAERFGVTKSVADRAIWGQNYASAGRAPRVNFEIRAGA